MKMKMALLIWQTICRRLGNHLIHFHSFTMFELYTIFVLIV